MSEKETPGSILAKYLTEPSEERLNELQKATEDYLKNSKAEVEVKIINGFKNQNE